ncbi:S-formylglutathione hydrolase [Stomoxys calcitrans]|uniref:S-formylglutathione hydrolase n=1 Tax=Stomoxys calcitrans TaxID=35570 RepID=UPI0027E3A681|nr:S-formylglutathione hydrolase [Stomoxys calcitrans]
MALELVSRSRCFEGEQRVYSHNSAVLGCEMKFGVFLPPCMLEGEKTECPVLYYLSGLTCTHENFIQKSGVQQYAAKEGICVVNPDTSPRNVNIPGEDASYDFGSGAGFYVNATKEPWSKNYHMYSYVTEELVELVNKNFAVLPNKKSIFGHSMGGHGALICALKNPGQYQSVSAFAPIANPMESDWGRKCFEGYLGDDKELWKQYDATHLAQSYAGSPLEIFIDQGSDDNFLPQLLPDNLLKTCAGNDHLQTVYKLRQGYDHAYYYIATFMGEHLAYHAKFLKN